MELRERCGLRADGRGWSSASRSGTARSSRSSWSPTQSDFGSLTWWSSASDESYRCGSGEELGDALQDYDGDDTLRLPGVVAEGREVGTVSFIEAIALGSLRDGRRPHRELIGPDLDLSLAMLHQVVVPAGMRGRAAFRGCDHVAVAIAVVHERRRPDHSAFRPTRGQQQQLVTEVTNTLAALRVELIDRALVP